MSSNINSPKRLEEVREYNLATIIRLLIKMKTCSRVELATAASLRQSTITNLTNILIHAGLVTETGTMFGKHGRRSIGITLSGQSFQVICVRLSRTSYTVERMDITGAYEGTISHSFSMNDPAEQIMQTLLDDVEMLIRTADRPILGIGAAVPGPFHRGKSRIIKVSNMRGWESICFSEIFQSRFHLPFVVEHDVNAAILAEQYYGDNVLDRGTHIYIALDYGIGAGILHNGHVLHGSIGIAGEIGHMSVDIQGPRCICGNRGCLEMYASSLALHRNLKSSLETGAESCLHQPLDFSDIAAALQQGDRLTVDAVKNAAEYMGMGLVNLVNCYNPDSIILGGDMTRLGEPYIEQVKRVLEEHTLPEIYQTTKITISHLPQDPALLGAGTLMVEELLRTPTLSLKLES